MRLSDGQAGPRFVVVEGNQGTGKSTATAYLAQRTGATRFHFPPGFEKLRERLALDEGMPPRPRLAIYVAASTRLSALVEGEVAAGRSVICDRYLAAPLSLLVAEGVVTEEEAEGFVDLALARVLRPFVTVLLVTEHGVAADRVRRRAVALDRPMAPVERMTLESPAFFARRQGALRRYSEALGPVEEIDTTEMSVPEMLVAVARAAGVEPGV